MKKVQLWLNFGLVFGVIWPRLTYVGETLNGASRMIFLLYDKSVERLGGLPFGNVLINLATDPLCFYIGSHYIHADKTALFVISAIVTILLSLIFLFWLVFDSLYWIIVKNPKKGFKRIRKINSICFVILLVYLLEWIVVSTLSSINMVKMFGYPSFGVYMMLVIGVVKTYIYYKGELEV